MLTSLFLSLLSYVLTFLSFFLPSGDTLSSGFTSSFQWLVAESYKFDYIFPITTIWLQITIVIPILVAIFGWYGIQWVIAFIRGQ